MKVILYIIFLISAPIVLSQTNTPNYLIQLYNVEKSSPAAIKNSSLNDAYKLLYTSYYYYWDAISNQNESSLSLANENLSEISNLQVDQTLSVLAELLQLRIDFKQKKYASAFSNHKTIKAYFNFQNASTDTPTDSLLLGLYHYFMSEARARSLISRVVFSSWAASNAETGIRLLEKCSQSNDPFISTEALYFLGRIYLEFEDEYELAYQNFATLNLKYPKNLIYSVFLDQCKIIVGSKKINYHTLKTIE